GLSLLWPLRAAGSAGGGSPAALAAAGLLAANGCFVASAVALHRLTRRTLGERLARRTALVYCATPASVFHSCVYTESPFFEAAGYAEMPTARAAKLATTFFSLVQGVIFGSPCGANDLSRFHCFELALEKRRSLFLRVF
ncbi:unnamed protein product, partial [Prorocentrum cordatum]